MTTDLQFKSRSARLGIRLLRGSFLASLLVAALAGCASTPGGVTSAAAQDCRQLGAEIARSEEAKREALDKQQNAWKAVIPFAVVARYASGKSAAAEADGRLADLKAGFARQGCKQ
jgi:hypothetical protein